MNIATANPMRIDPRLRLGQQIFQADHHWAHLPPTIQAGYTHGIVEDSKGRIYITNQSSHAVLVFDDEGQYLSSWGAEYASALTV
jgi:hypothetical protein